MGISNELTLEEAIEEFFKTPTKKTYEEKSRREYCRYSNLFLLRNDINICLGKYNDKQQIAIWPATMALLSGIDLLGYWLTYSSNSESRFKDYCSDYLDLNDKDKEIIYQLRCALFHSYTLYSKDNGVEYYFDVHFDHNQTSIVNTIENNHYIISLFNLHKKFEDSIIRFKSKVKNTVTSEKNSSYTQNFNNAIVNTGFIGWSEPQKKTTEKFFTTPISASAIQPVKLKVIK